MELLNTILQSLLIFMTGVLFGGLLQHRYKWLDKIVDFTN